MCSSTSTAYRQLVSSSRQGTEAPGAQLTRQILWLRVFAEGVVIVGSILLAFGIGLWWEGSSYKQREPRGLRPRFSAYCG
jgi:hypothetical protein